MIACARGTAKQQPLLFIRTKMNKVVIGVLSAYCVWKLTELRLDLAILWRAVFPSVYLLICAITFGTSVNELNQTTETKITNSIQKHEQRWWSRCDWERARERESVCALVRRRYTTQTHFSPTTAKTKRTQTAAHARCGPESLLWFGSNTTNVATTTAVAVAAGSNLFICWLHV